MIVPLTELDFLKRALAAHAHREAVVCGPHRFTYRQFGDRVNQWAQTMRQLGVEKGDRVAILSQNCHRMLEAFFGAPLIGAILMPLNFRLVPADFEYILNHGEAKVVIVEEGLTHLIDEIRPQLPSVKHYLIGADEESNVPSAWRSYEALLAAASSAPPEPAAIDENETAALLYTSGTTGKPKGVMMTQPQISTSTPSTPRLNSDCAPMMSTCTPLAMFHCNGWGLPYAVTGAGAKHVIVKKFEPGAFYESSDPRADVFCMHAADDDQYGFESSAR